MPNSYFTVSEIARERGLPPRIISDLFYVRKLDDSRCPIIGGRRVIPASYVQELDRALRELGLTSKRDVDAN